MTDTKTPAVDWQRPIEAVNSDGRVVPAKIVRIATTNTSYQAVKWKDWLISFSMPLSSAENGARNWNFRNVQTPAKPATELPQNMRQLGDTIDPAMVARMVALVRKLPDRFNRGTSYSNDPLIVEARSIVSDLPDEEDPDLTEAKKILGGAIDPAHNDYQITIVWILVALRRGREIERMKGEAR